MHLVGTHEYKTKCSQYRHSNLYITKIVNISNRLFSFDFELEQCNCFVGMGGNTSYLLSYIVVYSQTSFRLLLALVEVALHSHRVPVLLSFWNFPSHIMRVVSCENSLTMFLLKYNRNRIGIGSFSKK